MQHPRGHTQHANRTVAGLQSEHRRSRSMVAHTSQITLVSPSLVVKAGKALQCDQLITIWTHTGACRQRVLASASAMCAPLPAQDASCLPAAAAESLDQHISVQQLRCSWALAQPACQVQLYAPAQLQCDCLKTVQHSGQQWPAVPCVLGSLAPQPDHCRPCLGPRNITLRCHQRHRIAATVASSAPFMNFITGAFDVCNCLLSVWALLTSIARLARPILGSQTASCGFVQ